MGSSETPLAHAIPSPQTSSFEYEAEGARRVPKGEEEEKLKAAGVEGGGVNAGNVGMSLKSFSGGYQSLVRKRDSCNYRPSAPSTLKLLS